jgi:hypothetical protein
MRALIDDKKTMGWRAQIYIQMTAKIIRGRVGVTLEIKRGGAQALLGGEISTTHNMHAAQCVAR